MKVYWTQNAIEHLANVYEYIAFNSAMYAKGMVDKIRFIRQTNTSGSRKDSACLLLIRPLGFLEFLLP